MFKALLFNKYTFIVFGILSFIGISWYAFNNWHTKPLKDQADQIISLGNNIIVHKTHISTLKAQKEKLIGDMSIVYDNGYNAGFKEGFKYEKSNLATIHSITFPF